MKDKMKDTEGVRTTKFRAVFSKQLMELQRQNIPL